MSTTIQFYHLTATPLDRALPKLLERALKGGFKSLLLADSDDRIEQLNQLLWTFDPGSFLPHGSSKDGNVEQQPILLSTSTEAPNGANLLVITNGAVADQPEAFDRILDIFDGNNSQTVEKARNRWTHYKNSGYPLTYHRQTESGGWEQKAAA